MCTCSSTGTSTGRGMHILGLAPCGAQVGMHRTAAGSQSRPASHRGSPLACRPERVQHHLRARVTTLTGRQSLPSGGVGHWHSKGQAVTAKATAVHEAGRRSAIDVRCTLHDGRRRSHPALRRPACGSAFLPCTRGACSRIPVAAGVQSRLQSRRGPPLCRRIHPSPPILQRNTHPCGSRAAVY